jgi:hypothetical protein
MEFGILKNIIVIVTPVGMLLKSEKVHLITPLFIHVKSVLGFGDPHHL